MKTLEYNNCLVQLNQLIIGEKIRVTLKIARALLLNNQAVVIGGKVYYLCIRNLGLGVCSVELYAGKETKMGIKG